MVNSPVDYVLAYVVVVLLYGGYGLTLWARARRVRARLSELTRERNRA